MSVLVDTGVFVAFLNAEDSRNQRAREIFSDIRQGQYGAPMTTDYVLNEALTFLRRRPGRREVSDAFVGLVLGQRTTPAPIRLLSTPVEVLIEAVRKHFDHYDRRLSITDCSLLSHARRLSCQIVTFDGGFQGLGVPIIS